VTLGTPDLPEVAVDFKEVSAPGFEVKPIDVLSDEGEMREPGLEIDQSFVAWVEGEACDEIPAPVIKLPYQLRVPRKGMRRRKFHDIMVAPETVCPAKGRNAAFCRDPGPGQCGDPLRFDKGVSQCLDLLLHEAAW
jgi:hypothetical protein